MMKEKKQIKKNFFDPRGIRQMQEKNIPALGSLLAGINKTSNF